MTRILLALLLFAALPLRAAEPVDLTGTFQGIEQGDYAYFLLRTDAGDDESLMILQTDAALEEFVEHADALKGTRVKVRVEDRRENITEAGGEIDVRVIVGVAKLPPR
ncbi:MAG TPA: hypothetical protein VFL14_16580 [Xanthomonadales bacterium]|nr:hypothetical protein [Xanthomonadales bacterium]